MCVPSAISLSLCSWLCETSSVLPTPSHCDVSASPQTGSKGVKCSWAETMKLSPKKPLLPSDFCGVFCHSDRNFWAQGSGLVGVLPSLISVHLSPRHWLPCPVPRARLVYSAGRGPCKRSNGERGAPWAFFLLDPPSWAAVCICEFQSQLCLGHGPHWFSEQQSLPSSISLLRTKCGDGISPQTSPMPPTPWHFSHLLLHFHSVLTELFWAGHLFLAKTPPY